MSNGCPVCAGIGRVIASGVCRDPIAVPCPECAGLSITPASADEEMRELTARQVTWLLLRYPMLPEAPPEEATELREAVAD
jgi:hypothetical protein